MHSAPLWLHRWKQFLYRPNSSNQGRRIWSAQELHWFIKKVFWCNIAIWKQQLFSNPLTINLFQTRKRPRKDAAKYIIRHTEVKQFPVRAFYILWDKWYSDGKRSCSSERHWSPEATIMSTTWRWLDRIYQSTIQCLTLLLILALQHRYRLNLFVTMVYTFHKP